MPDLTNTSVATTCPAILTFGLSTFRSSNKPSITMIDADNRMPVTLPVNAP